MARDMFHTFDSIRFGLMVGIGGGVPSSASDIRLGDVVVSKPSGTSGGVIQYDFGKMVQDGRFTRICSLNRPLDVILRAVASLQAKHIMENHKILDYLSNMMEKYPAIRKEFAYQGVQHDQLFETDYEHAGNDATCEQCDANKLIIGPLVIKTIQLFYGLIASANQIMSHGRTRDRLGRELQVLCFDMEAAGLTDKFPCLVIRASVIIRIRTRTIVGNRMQQLQPQHMQRDFSTLCPEIRLLAHAQRLRHLPEQVR